LYLTLTKNQIIWNDGLSGAKNFINHIVINSQANTGTLEEFFSLLFFNPILHTAWLNNLALTLKRNTAKYYFGEKIQFFAYLPKDLL
jgi:hypothetical protein